MTERESLKNSKTKKPQDNYAPLQQNDEEKKGLNVQTEVGIGLGRGQHKDIKVNKYEKLKSNLYKSRIIDSEITSSLILQTILYYNFYFSIMNFYIEITSVIYKIWIFEFDKILYIRVIFVFFSVIFEIYRLHIGYLANIQESFPNLLQTAVFSFIFALPCQVILVIYKLVSPLDYATACISIGFILIEIILIIRAIQRSINKQAAVFHLRNSSTKTFTSDKAIKSSHEIEEELFFNFPHLRDQYANSRVNKSYSHSDMESKKDN